MAISISRKNKTKTGPDAAPLLFHPDSSLVRQKHSRLIDIRNPEVFCQGFIPGSYNVPDAVCAAAARRVGLFQGREVYLLAEDLEQVESYSEYQALATASQDSALAGWFGAEALAEWQRSNAAVGSLEVVNSETLGGRMDSLNIFTIDIFDAGEERALGHPSALRFQIDHLPLSLEGLPVETSICVMAARVTMASFAASLLWNFGFRRVSYLNRASGIVSEGSDRAN